MFATSCSSADVHVAHSANRMMLQWLPRDLSCPALCAMQCRSNTPTAAVCVRSHAHSFVIFGPPQHGFDLV